MGRCLTLYGRFDGGGEWDGSRAYTFGKRRYNRYMRTPKRDGAARQEVVEMASVRFSPPPPILRRNYLIIIIIR
jgi:hypothetical protein